MNNIETNEPEKLLNEKEDQFAYWLHRLNIDPIGGLWWNHPYILWANPDIRTIVQQTVNDPAFAKLEKFRYETDIFTTHAGIEWGQYKKIREYAEQLPEARRIVEQMTALRMNVTREDYVYPTQEDKVIRGWLQDENAIYKYPHLYDVIERQEFGRRNLVWWLYIVGNNDAARALMDTKIGYVPKWGTHIEVQKAAREETNKFYLNWYVRVFRTNDPIDATDWLKTQITEPWRQDQGWVPQLRALHIDVPK